MVIIQTTKQTTMEQAFPSQLLKVISFLNKIGIKCNFDHEDGRVNSIEDEETVIRCLEDKFGKKNVQRPKPRDWWDVRIFGYPVQIKSSNVARGCADNFSSKAAILYALTYLPEDKVVVKQWAEFEEALLRYSDVENGRDYYIIVLDKGTKKLHLTSLKSLNKVTPNRSNLPFQIKWKDNLSPVSRTFEEAKEVIIGAYKKSVMAKLAAHPFISEL
jgi:hypothetical protein